MISRLYRQNRDLVLVGGLLAILLILFAPIPPAVVDLAIITNFGFALTILLMAFYVRRPVDFSTFPSLLLMVTLLRLGINVAATRLILTEAEAGDVIAAVGNFAVGGNYIVGIVVFSILVVVQFVVVTSGAQRVSEVAARFTLDSMPGQQMSIDADLNMGLIDQAEAQRRRHEIEQEASFYGAMDGASKFVKGDAIAAIIILLINIIAGSLIGILQLGLSWSESLKHFTLLTIGDGIAAQLPALIVSVATGIIVTRSSADRDLSTEVFAQLSSIPRVSWIVAAALFVLMLLPGMPKWPIAILFGIVALIWWQSRNAEPEEMPSEMTVAAADDLAQETRADGPEILLGADLAEAWKEHRGLLLDRISAVRRAHMQEFGAPLPPVRVVDGEGLGLSEYEIRLFGTRFGLGTSHPDMLLAISAKDPNARIEGLETIEPMTGQKAFWIQPGQTDDARDRGFSVVEPIVALTAHFADIIRAEAARLLSRPVFTEMVEAARQRQPSLIEDLIPTILSLSDVQRVMRNLLGEGVSIANLDLILENLLDLARNQRDPDELSELLRQRIGFAICNKLRGPHRELSVMSLDPRLENEVTANLGTVGRGLDPRTAEGLVRRIAPIAEQMFRQGRNPVLLCATEIRRAMKLLTQRAIPRLSVISVNEIPERIDLSSFDVVRIDG
ncbi:flagellar biosynthesis protein FlhA [Sphingomonas colocasiae]|uniref:Flagellar biosynthesis protein FlhA n=1 Tax=Sphingomonas colocasiae TaxID=1848973 RepID=A0ABS7PW89_9SPHN|nr:flagellar biosynthesis protein FlhA [Sphingomonas colocasiae]MBY8825546.1 flagellar biosynthesis protein FlhA [Sphingomonas colocasiae]